MPGYHAGVIKEKNFSYPLRSILEKAFQDAAYTLFVKPSGMAGDFYRIELSVPLAKLRHKGPGPVSFEMQVNATLRDPKDHVVEMRSMSVRSDSSFDGQTTPNAVWTACYQAADGFLRTLRHSARVRSMARAPKELPPTYPVPEREEPSFQAKQYKNRFALIIGVENYKDCPKAEFACNDAKEMNRYAQRLMGIPRSNVKCVLDANLTDMKKYLEGWLPKMVGATKNAFV